MVNLKKEDLNKPIREYTPVHIREEYTPSQEYTPEHLCEENIPNQVIPVVEVVPPKQELAVCAGQLSYSKAIKDCRRQHLASCFQSASDKEIEGFRSLSVPLKSLLKKYLISSITALSAAIFSLLCLIGLIVSLPLHNNFISTAMLIGGEASLFSLVMLACMTIGDNNSVLMYKTLKSVSDIYISHDGANYKTINKIKECSQRIDCDVFRPRFCKDNKAYEAVVRDKHDVFVLYSNKTKSAVIIDPKLFE